MSLGLAGTGVQTGLKFKLEGIATAGFDARAKFTYARKRTVEGGVIAMHTIGDSTFKTNMGGFDFQDSNQDDTSPATLDVNVKAHASVTLRPIFSTRLGYSAANFHPWPLGRRKRSWPHYRCRVLLQNVGRP